MRRFFVIPFFLLSVFALFLVSCSGTKKITATPNTPPAPKASLKKENAYSLMSKLKGDNFNYKWISAHFSADITDDTISKSFSGVIRIRKDSVVWMTVSVGLGAYTALHAKLDADSIMFIDHYDQQYFKGTYDYLDTLFREDIDFELIHSVLVGNSLEFYHDTARIKAYFDGHDYILSTVTKRKYRKLMYKNRPLHTHSDAQLIRLDSADFHIKSIRLENFITKHTFEATYEDFQKQDSGSAFPMHIKYVINTGRKTITIDLKYKRVNFTNSESIPFIIPKKYVQIRY